MPNKINTPPSQEKLCSYRDGKMDTPEADMIAEHVSDCEQCRASLSTNRDDSSVETGRTAGSELEPAVGRGGSEVSVVESLFERALQLTKPDQIKVLLEEECHDDTVRKKVEAMLAAQPELGSFLTSADTLTESMIQTGTFIGPYKIREQIGEGGMGVVYCAEQLEPVRRKVALKVIKPGMDSREILARFEAERQALAMLDHPNITHVLDAGLSENDRPYFVMELVRGIPITKFCDESQLSLRDRLQLFQTTCNAVQHAHQKGIIHRDLKPSNIMVTQISGKPVIKIIDFGLAKATGDQRLTDKTVYTRFMRMMGTPAYMSPEQVGMSSMDVDTRSDIYSLGVLLYELLTGTTPLDKTTLHEKPYDDLCRVIREVNAPRPSDRISTLEQANLTTVSERRSIESNSFRRTLRGDLDRVALKSLQKDREQRYQTASEFAEDIRLYLEDKPVTAVSPSPIYLLRKYAKRHRLAIVTVATIAILLLLATMISTWLALKANSAQLVAAERGQQVIVERDNALAAKDLAENQQRRMYRLAYASDMNLAAREIQRGNTVRAKELLDRYRVDVKQDDRENLRGWEWRHLWQFCQEDPHELIVDLKGYKVKRLSISHTGRHLAISARSDEQHRSDRIYVRDLIENAPVMDFPGSHATFSPTEPLLAYWSAAAMGESTAPGGFVLWNPVFRKTVNHILLPTGQAMRGVEFSADGKTLAVSAAPWNGIHRNQLILVDIATAETKSFHAPQVGPGAGYPFAIAADSSFAVHGTGNAHESYVRVIDLKSGNEKWRSDVATKGEWVECLTLSPDKRLAVIGYGLANPTLQVWDLEKEKMVAVLEGHMAYVRHVSFAAPRQLISSSADRTVQIWDLTDLDNIPKPRILRAHTGEVSCVVAVQDRQLISGSARGRVVRWDLGKSKGFRSPQFRFNGADMACRIRPDQTAIVTFQRNSGVVSQWTGDQYETASELFRLEPGFHAASISQDAMKLAVGYKNGDVGIIDIQRQEQILLFKAGEVPMQPGRFYARDQLVEVSYAGGKFLWDLQQNAKKYVWSHSNSSVSLDGSVGVASRANQFELTNFSGQAPTKLPAEWKGSFRFGAATLSPDGRFLAASQGRLQRVKVWDLDTGDEKASVGSGFMVGPASTSFSPDSQRLIAGGAAPASILMFDLESQQRVMTLDSVGDTRRHAQFAADGDVIRAEDEAGVIYGWRAPSWQEIEEFEADR